MVAELELTSPSQKGHTHQLQEFTWEGQLILEVAAEEVVAEVTVVEEETAVMEEAVAAMADQAGTAVDTAEDHLLGVPLRRTTAVEVEEVVHDEITAHVQDLILHVFKKYLQDSQLLV